MKFSSKKFTNTAGAAARAEAMAGLQYPPPPVPLEQPEPRELKKSEFLKLNLKSNPGNPNSETYSICIPYFKHGTPSGWIFFNKTFKKIIVGQNLKTGSAKYTMARTLLQGDALRIFEKAAKKFGW